MSRLVLFTSIFAALQGCAAARLAQADGVAEALRLHGDDVAPPLAPPPPRSPFARDTFALGDAELERLLAFPVALDPKARVGVVRVTDHYQVEDALPLDGTPQVLVEALQAAGLAAGVTEISTEWPADRGLPGLRELSARYRARYLLLYRPRLVEHLRANGWAAGYATVVGAFFLPGTTYEHEGVLEATLFDALTGAVVFTTHERASGEGVATPLHVPVAAAGAKRALVERTAPKLAQTVLESWRRLLTRATELSGLP